MQAACDALWRFTGELFQPVEGVDVDWAELESDWLASVSAVLERAGITVPDGRG